MEFNYTIQTKEIPQNEEGISADLYVSPTKATAGKTQLEKILLKNIPHEIDLFYSKPNKFSLELRVKNQFVTIIQGSSMILSYQQYLFGIEEKNKKIGERHKNILWKTGEENMPKVKLLESNYFVFDTISPMAGIYGMISIVEEEHQVALYKYPHRIYPLTLSFSEYIAYNLKYGSAFLWQEQFIAIEKVTKKDLEALQQERSPIIYPCFENVFPELQTLFSKHEIGIFESIKSQKWKLRFSQRLKDLQSKSSKFDLNYDDSWNSETDIPGMNHFDPLSVQLAEYELGKKLPDALIAFYAQINGMKLHWEHESFSVDDYFADANFELVAFHEVFALEQLQINRDYKETLLLDFLAGDQTEDEIQDFAKQCRPIFHSEFTHVVINVEEDNFPLYMIARGKFYPLTVDFEGFIEALLQCMGLEYFPRFISDPKAYPQEELEYSSFFIPFLENVFPDADKSMFRKLN